MMGEKEFFDAVLKSHEDAQRMQTDKKYEKRVKCCGRIRADLPLIAIVLMLIGFLLCFNYSAF